MLMTHDPLTNTRARKVCAAATGAIGRCDFKTEAGDFELGMLVGQSDALRLHQDRAMAWLLISTGMTLAEVCALKTRDVLPLNEGGYALCIGRKRRLVPLESETVKLLSRWLTLRPLVQGAHRTPLLFISHHGDALTAVAVRRVVNQLQATSGVAFDTFALRHTFISNRCAKGWIGPALRPCWGGLRWMSFGCMQLE